MTEFVNENPHYLDPENALAFLSDDEGGSYNMCHCTCRATCCRPFESAKWSRIVWSNFEIANLDFWRGEAYSKFFEHLESKGGFYYEVRQFHLLCRPLLLIISHLSFRSSSRTLQTLMRHQPLRSNSAGATHPSTASARRSLRARTRSTSSTT